MAKREYLLAGALAMAAAVIGIAIESAEGEGTGRRGELLVVGLLAAVMYGRVAFGLLRRKDDDEAGPSAGRMRRMAIIWYLLAGVLGVAAARMPNSTFPRRVCRRDCRRGSWIATWTATDNSRSPNSLPARPRRRSRSSAATISTAMG